MDRPVIRLRNSLTRRVEEFVPIDRENVRLYLCGPTVYDRAHLGNARNVILFDLLFRLLRHDYGAGQVTYVRNFTDVDDKIIARAAETGRDIAEITAETTQWYLDDMAALGTLEPTAMPRATDYIGEMVEMIAGLVASGHAYAAEGHVLFSVSSYEGYGSLSGRSTDDMVAGARVEVAPYKRDPMDFVLWKPSEAAEPGWDSPWGRGRPGWHIECSAMTKALLGTHFDIHGGGNDLLFPHHENERAQSCCADPGTGFANLWLHNEMLMVEGRKMSKSLGNFFTVRDLLDRGVPGEVIRFVFLSTHYSKPMDWTEQKAREAAKVLQRWYSALRAVGYSSSMVHLFKERGVWEPDGTILSLLRNNLNTAGAIKRLHELSSVHGSALKKAPFAASLEMLGLIPDWDILADLSGSGVSQVGRYDEELERSVTGLLFRRQQARARRDFVEADRIRDLLNDAGIIVSDTGGIPSWKVGPNFDPAKLEGLA